MPLQHAHAVDVIIIDDDEPGFTTQGTWTYWTPGGYQGDFRFASPGPNPSSDYARWSFGTFPAGTYSIAATWSPHPNRATNAPFKIFKNGSLIQTTLINQELYPDDLTANAAFWKRLMTITLTSSSTLSVELSNQAANEYVIADAIRIERTGP